MVDQWRNETARTPIIGFISTWPVCQGTTIDRYAHSLIQGISAAANEQGYSLLLGCHVDSYSRQRLGPR